MLFNFGSTGCDNVAKAGKAAQARKAPLPINRMRTKSCQTNLSKLLPWLAGHPLQGGDLPEELVPRLCWASQQYGSSRDVVDHACLCADLGALADVQVPAIAAWPPTWTKSSSTVEPAMPTWATITQQRPSRTLCPI